MRQTKFISLAFCALLAGAVPARAQDQACATPLPALLTAAAKADARLKSVSESTEHSRAYVVATYRVLEAAIAKVAKARSENAEVELDRAISALSSAKKAYDQAVTAERPQLIARLEAERALRGARQALSEAASRLREQGQALVNAVERIQRGQVAPSATDRLVCEQTDCVKVPAVEHAAMIAIGAVAETVVWPVKNETCDFTLLLPDKNQGPVMRNLRDAQKNAQSNLKAAEDNILAARQVLAAGIPAWDGAIAATLDAHASPAGNSHADELLGMAIEDLRKQSVAFNKLAAPYRTADEVVTAAKLTANAATTTLNQHLAYWADLGRAVMDAAARAERGIAPRGSTTCPAGPTSQAGPWIFPLSPPPNC